MKIKSMSERLKEQIKKEAYSTSEIEPLIKQLEKKLEKMDYFKDNSVLEKLGKDIEELQNILINAGYHSDMIDEIEETFDKLMELIGNSWKVGDSIRKVVTKWDSSIPFGQ